MCFELLLTFLNICCCILSICAGQGLKMLETPFSEIRMNFFPYRNPHSEKNGDHLYTQSSDTHMLECPIMLRSPSLAWNCISIASNWNLAWFLPILSISLFSCCYVFLPSGIRKHPNKCCLSYCQESSVDDLWFPQWWDLCRSTYTSSYWGHTRFYNVESCLDPALWVPFPMALDPTSGLFEPRHRLLLN